MIRAVLFIALGFGAVVLWGPETYQGLLDIDPVGANIEDYAGAITSWEMLVLTIGNDLRTYRRRAGLSPDTSLDEAHRLAIDLVDAGVVWRPTGGWVLQPGALATHPDHIHAGHQSIRPGLDSAIVDSLGPDVSHFLSKWPTFLRALGEAAEPGSFDAIRVRQWEQGIVEQLRTRVVTPPLAQGDSYMFATYMDGTDGVYRLAYEGRGATWGYQAGSFSIVPYYAPLVLLRDPYVWELYEYLATTDVEDALLATSGPGTATFFAKGHPLVLVSAETGREDDSGQPVQLSRTAREAFERAVRPELLADDAWVGDNAYEGVSSRQVYLHAAFWHDEPVWKQTFTEHMRRFVGSVSNGWPQTSAYYQLHQLALASRYLALSADDPSTPPLPELAAYLESRFNELWHGDGETVVSATGWGEPAFKSYRDWVEWKVGVAQARARSSISLVPDEALDHRAGGGMSLNDTLQLVCGNHLSNRGSTGASLETSRESIWQAVGLAHSLCQS